MSLEVDALSVKYGRHVVLTDATLTVQPGSITSIVGPNGAGKSSLLNSMAGLVPAFSGRVAMDGRNLSGLASENLFRQGLALVAEGKRVFSSLTVEENMKLAAASFGRANAESRIDKCLNVFPKLKDRRGQRASSLSGGEQQQLMIARALVGSPKYLLLDEPSLGLAPQVVQEVLSTLRDLSAEGVGVLLVEQFVQQAVSVSTYVHVLSRGRLQERMSGQQAKDALATGDFFQAYSGRHYDARGTTPQVELNPTDLNCPREGTE